VYVIKGFGVIAMTLGVFAIISYLSGSSTSSTASVVIGLVSLLVGAALFFLPGRRWADR
jgi:uncharacterized membrane protein HdeD (DUF308 family)